MRRDVSFLSQLSPNGDPRRAHQQTAELGEVQLGNQRHLIEGCCIHNNDAT
jgi:hypothetical protein